MWFRLCVCVQELDYVLPKTRYKIFKIIGSSSIERDPRIQVGIDIRLEEDDEV